MDIPQHIQPLIEKYLAGSISKEELVTLNDWYRSFDDTEVEIVVPDNLSEEVIKNRIHRRLMSNIRENQELQTVKPKHRWRMQAAVAIVIAVTGLSVLLLLQSKKHEVAGVVQNDTTSPKNDIAPGGNKAVLILADGSSVVLDSSSNGVISRQGNIDIKKTANGLLSYTINGKEITENDAAFYNTISTPRGGQYQVTLADGTQVWLNAASSIRFPVVFTGTERNVVITGEVYFEVAKNKNMPFKVKAASSDIEVLGTHFNVNSYEDETYTKTTLLEGKVKVNIAGQQARFLQPGQQSAISKNGNIEVLNNVDTEEVMAWKNGRFQYASTDIKTILRQISRWYDVDVEYRGNINLHFTGQLPRSVTASKVFEKLEMTGEVHIIIEGKRIIVTP